MANNEDNWGIPMDDEPIDNSNTEVDNWGTQDETGNESNTNNEPVVMSKKKVGAILIALIFILIIILFTIRGMSIQRKSNGNGNSTVADVRDTEISTESSEIVDEVGVNNTENVVISEEVSSSSTEEILTTESEGFSPIVVIEETTEATEEVTTEAEVENTSMEKSNGLQEVEEPVLSDIVETSGIVSGKSIYQVENNYLYAIKLIVVVGDDQNITCKYFCPRRSWDNLSTGTSVNITLQTDSNGNISIISMSN